MKMRFFDFEVFPHWWCCVFGDLPEDWKETGVTEKLKDTFTYVSSDDKNCRDELLSKLKEPGYCVSGYNIKGYDLIIANAIYQGFTPEQIKIINDIIINPGCAWDSKEHIMLQSFAKRKLTSLCYSDLMDDATGSLKEKEATLGLNILESSVDFNKEDLTEEDKVDVIYYCKQDVYAALQFYIKVAAPYVSAKLTVGKVFNIPEDICYKSTNARLVAISLHAHRTEFDDRDRIQIDLPYRIKEYCYQNIPKNVLEHLLNKQESLTVNMLENIFSYGNGGVHSTPGDDIYVESNDEWMLMNVDATSFYPSIMIQLKCLSRAVENPDYYEYIFNERVRIKHLPNRTVEDNETQLAYKLILNTTFGASGNKYLDMFDPHMCTKVCRVGQLLLTALACKLYHYVPGLKIIQTNTDGILVYFRRKDIDKVRQCEKEWTANSGINMEEDEVDRIWQRNVNNYLLVKMEKDGPHIKRKGGWLNDTIYRYGYVMLSPLSAFVCAKAASEFLLHGTDIIQSIVNNKDINDFAITCTKGPTFRGVVQRMSDGTEVQLYKANRVIASKNPELGMLYKYKVYKGEIRYNKMPNVPEHCKTVNEDLSTYDFNELKKEIDYMYYIERTADLLDIEWKTYDNGLLVKTNKFDLDI